MMEHLLHQNHPEPQAMESGEGSEFLLYTILGTNTVA